MSKAGEKVLKGAREALACVRGEGAAHRTHVLPARPIARYGSTLNWTTTDATASIIGYLAMGAVYSPGPGVSGKRGGWMWCG